MLDIRKIKNGYWWDAQGKFDALIDGKNELRELTIQVTDKCNKNCVKCNRTSFTSDEMPTLKVLSILEQALALGLRHVHLTGGECTMHDGLPIFVDWCSERNVRIDISTNGEFDENKYGDIARAGLDSVNISWDFIEQVPKCIGFVSKYAARVFVNHMVMPSNFSKLPDFLRKIKTDYPFVADIQLMPPRGTAKKFSDIDVAYFNKEVAVPAYLEAFDRDRRIRFPMVEAKVLEMLGPLAHQGIYHPMIRWPCHRMKGELRVGCKGYSACTYLYRDGLILAEPDVSVAGAWAICKEACKSSPPIPSMCDWSCSPEVSCFNLLVELGLKSNPKEKNHGLQDSPVRRHPSDAP
jgi:molybdenum cofactor biosynthesis enzyme MoaA